MTQALPAVSLARSGEFSGARSRYAVAVGVLLSILPGVACSGPKKPPPPPPPTVLVATVAKRDLPLFVEAVGTLDGYVNADIRARAKGYLRTQAYKDGATVKEGQLLFTIEDTEYVNAVASARAALSRATASKVQTSTSLSRVQQLVSGNLVAKQDLDNAVASAADASGQVQAAQAALQQAQLNLSYTRIHAPVSGVAGLALVRVGNLVGQDAPTLLTTVSQLDPVRVNFPLSELDYVRFPNRLKQLDQRDVAWAKRQFPRLDAHQLAEGDDPGIELILADNSVYPHRGLLVTANRQVDASTGTIQLQALFPNADGSLRPGQYGRVRIPKEGEGKSVIAVPEKALISVQGNYSVGVVGADNKVKLRPVELGNATLGVRIVNKGLSEGERIVVEGIQKISDGSLVVPQAAPAASASGSSSAPAGSVL